MNRAFVVGCVFGLLTVGCGDLAEPTVGGTGANVPDSQEPPVVPPVNPNPPGAPDLAGLPARYGYLTIPVWGQTDPKTTVFVEGGAAPAQRDPISDGTFCVDVPLRSGQSNNLRVFAQDTEGRTSDPAEASVVHDPSLAQTTTPEPELKADLASSLAPSSNPNPKAGPLANLTDENLTTEATMPRLSYVWLDLGAEYDLESIEIVFPAEQGSGDPTFATEYMVLASNQSSPTLPPVYNDPTWTVIADVYPGSGVDAGDGGTDKFTLPTPLRTRYVAFFLELNNKAMFWETDDIRLAEIRLAGRSTQELPSEPLTPTCANGRMP